MDMNLFVGSLAVWTLACVAFGWWVRGHENASIASDHMNAELEIHSGPGDVEKRARRAF